MLACGRDARDCPKCFLEFFAPNSNGPRPLGSIVHNCGRFSLLRVQWASTVRIDSKFASVTFGQPGARGWRGNESVSILGRTRSAGCRRHRDTVNRVRPAKVSFRIESKRRKEEGGGEEEVGRVREGGHKSIQHSCVHVSMDTRMTIIQRAINKLAGKNNNVLVQI